MGNWDPPRKHVGQRIEWEPDRDSAGDKRCQTEGRRASRARRSAIKRRSDQRGLVQFEDRPIRGQKSQRLQSDQQRSWHRQVDAGGGLHRQRCPVAADAIVMMMRSWRTIFIRIVRIRTRYTVAVLVGIVALHLARIGDGGGIPRREGTQAHADENAEHHEP